jgi:membrane fusion protein, heavy metal efflux system
LPGIGQRVRAEQIVAWLEPLPDSLDRAEHEADLAELARRIAFAEQELRRLEQLRESATPRQIEQARAEWQALEARQKALQRALREPRPLRAPLAGTIADSRLALGQVVAAGNVCWRSSIPAGCRSRRWRSITRSPAASRARRRAPIRARR